MILFILGFVLLICSLIFYYKTNQIKIFKDEQKQIYKKKLQQDIFTLQINKRDLIQAELKQKEKLNQNLSQLREKCEKELNKNLQKQTQRIQLNIQKINNQASQEIEIIHKDLNNIRESANQQKQQLQNQLNKIKASLNAGVEARLREQQKKDKLNFYKLSLTDNDLADVKMLENLKSSFHNPIVLSKLIWTQYFQKQMTELCDRILSKKTICGIYKITNLLTEQCYIGQSVNVADRWKQHCKCGLGIDASSTNKLYNAMQKDGVWNFTFELLQECSKELLNQKEKLWIQMYQSNNFGYNTTKGNRA